MKRKLITKITERGQIQLPAARRRALDLRASESLTWELIDGRRILLTPTRVVNSLGARAGLGYALKFSKGSNS